MIRRTIRLTGTLLIILAAGIAAVAAVSHFTGISFPTLPGITSQSRTAHSDLIFEEARDLYRLVTAEYVVKTVFPHDFIPGGYSIERILQRVRGSQDPLTEILTPRERAYLELYNLGLDTGLPARADSTRFIVFTAVLSAGYDLKGTAFAATTATSATSCGSADLKKIFTSREYGGYSSFLRLFIS